jgi:putative toxin-antitoxin system antitoxin component (TIGR02293 family)
LRRNPARRRQGHGYIDIHEGDELDEAQMADLSKDRNFSVERSRLAEVAGLLGAPHTFRKVPQNPLEAHEMLLRGLPTKALVHLVQNFVVLHWDEAFAKAVGMSQRTYQRQTSARTKQLSPEQSGRTWKLAESLAEATAVLGSREEAEQWLKRPAIGLDQRRPIDLLATPAGTQLVEDFLVRLEYGVYA